MSEINLLSSKIYNRIAAGEVIERPASVVKELVENSIDADSSSIIIEILNGGLACITVTDNGCGIEKDQLKKALMPHATSKISSIKDLDAIETLGFRGEALPSIASVSKVTIKSKYFEHDFGAEIYAAGDEISSPKECAMQDGTQIIVENLFYNAPVRAKFLKSEKGEEREITSLISKFILGNPHISFKYIANGKVVLQSFGDGLESAFLSVYGVDALDDCFYVSTEKNGIDVRGYIGKPYYYKTNRTYQTVFLNGRYVSNNTISSAISNAYAPFLMRRQCPFCVLNIMLPVDAVDVNVHPNKTDVRFRNNQMVYGTIYSIIAGVLKENRCAVTFESIELEKNKKPTKGNKNTNSLLKKYDTRIDNSLFETLIFESSVSKDTTSDDSVDIFAENKKYLEELEKNNNNNTIVTPNNIPTDAQDNAKKIINNFEIEKDLVYVGQALNTYLIYQTSDEIFFADQHALHERILFDKIIESFEKKDIISQPFLTPYILNVNILEFNFLSENIDVLKNMGIDICSFGDNSFKISALPVFLTDFNVKKFFDDILAEIGSLKNITAKDLLKDKFAQKACKSAIKSGDKLSKEEIDELTKVLKNNLGIKCPHGRPVVIKITRTDIDKWFKRIL